MQPRTYSAFCFFLFIIGAINHASAQLEITIPDDEFEEFDYIPNDNQNKTLNIKNTADTTVLFDWEYIISDSAEIYFEAHVSDINQSFLPYVNTICGFDFPNSLVGQDSYNMGLHVRISDLQAEEEFVKEMSVTLNLLSHPDCNDTLSSITVPFVYFITQNKDIQENKFSVYPNPSTNKIILDQDFPALSQYSIVDLHGKIFDESLLTTEEISIENLPHGVYILSVESKNKIWYSKFVKFD